MTSVLVVARLGIVPQAAAWVRVDSSRTAMRDALTQVDLLLMILGGVIGSLALILWFAGSRHDPLALRPWRSNRLREDSLLLAMLVFLTTFLLAAGIVDLTTGNPATEPAGGAAASAAQIAGMAICLWIAARTFDGGVRRFCLGEGGAVGENITCTALITVAALGLCPVILLATSLLIRYVHPEYEFKTHGVIEALRDEARPAGITIALWLGAIVIAPIAEEFFFRGLLQTYLVGFLRHRTPIGDNPDATADRIERPAVESRTACASGPPGSSSERSPAPSPTGRCRWLALGIASLVFGFAHFAQPHTVPALVLLGVLFGYAYERTGALWPPIVIHAVFNLKTLIFEALTGPGG